MPIKRLLENSGMPPERREVMEIAFAAALKKLDLVDRNDPICEIVALKVLKVGAAGDLDAVTIADLASKELDPRGPR